MLSATCLCWANVTLSCGSAVTESLFSSRGSRRACVVGEHMQCMHACGKNDNRPSNVSADLEWQDTERSFGCRYASGYLGVCLQSCSWIHDEIHSLPRPWMLARLDEAAVSRCVGERLPSARYTAHIKSPCVWCVCVCVSGCGVAVGGLDEQGGTPAGDSLDPSCKSWAASDPNYGVISLVAFPPMQLRRCCNAHQHFEPFLAQRGEASPGQARVYDTMYHHGRKYGPTRPVCRSAF